MKSFSSLKSVIFSPGDRIKIVEKACNLFVDAVIFDLEDAVSPDKKESSRNNLVNFLSSQEIKGHSSIKKPLKAVRINCPITSQWGMDDLKAFCTLGLDALVLPKVEDMKAIDYASQLINESRNNNSRLPIWAMIETAKGIENVNNIAASDNVQTIILGTNDLSKDLQLRIRNRYKLSFDPLFYSKSRCIVAARANGKSVIDGVFMDIYDGIGLEDACNRSRDMGFDGITLIHPNQIETANNIFSPSAEEVIYATRVIKAYDEARAQGKSLAVLDGKLIEYLHVEQAKNVLVSAKSIESE